MEKAEEPVILFGKSKWIWSSDATAKNSNVIMRRTFSFGQEKPPARALCRIACESHYYMFVNGNAVVWNGSFPRGKNAYYDEVDIAKYLIKGDNVIVFHCVYYGTDGRDVVAAPRAGFIFECNDLNIYSDNSFTVYLNRAYKAPRSNNCCYAGSDVNYDASLEGQIQNVLDPAYNSSLFVPATELDAYPDTAMGALLPRPVPLERFSAQPVIAKAKKLSDQFDGDKYIITLPREMTVTPYFEVAGNGQEKITVVTDRTECMGCFGDETSTYRAHSVEYLTKPTLNVFECLLPMTGNSLIFTMPRSVKVIKLGYREIGYDTYPTCEFTSDDEVLDNIFDKAVNTLYASMLSTIMDTPERDRCFWLGDASIASRALYFAYYDAAELVEKAVRDVFDCADGNMLYSCVPGSVPVDIPSHGLTALGEYGLFANVFDFTTETEIFRTEFERLCEYLLLWDMTEHGVMLRDGTRRWYDNLYNTDEVLLENALYYSACKFMRRIAQRIGNRDYDETFDDRMTNIAEYIESTFDGLGYTSSGDFYDDRANAFIVLAGLVPEDRYAAIARLLSATFNASPYTEWAVLEALGKLGRTDLARKRFDMRNALDAVSEKTTLGEDFMGFGTDCQSYRTAAVFQAIQLFAGIDVKNGASVVTIAPDFRAIKDLRLKLKLASGELEVRYKYSPARIDILIENRTTAKVELDIAPERIERNVEPRRITLNKGKNKFAI